MHDIILNCIYLNSSFSKYAATSQTETDPIKGTEYFTVLEKPNFTISTIESVPDVQNIDDVCRSDRVARLAAR